MRVFKDNYQMSEFKYFDTSCNKVYFSQIQLGQYKPQTRLGLDNIQGLNKLFDLDIKGQGYSDVIRICYNLSSIDIFAYKNMKALGLKTKTIL